ncbi:MAG: recombination mediator RecR [Nitriliruptoraceae bacterium]
MYEGAVQDVIDELGRLPGIGPKSAQRITFYLLQADPASARRLAEVIVTMKETMRFCTTCHNVSQTDVCRICRDDRRDQSLLCVVEEIRDVVAIERTREYRGLYHVLGGAISPIDGVGPDDLNIASLLSRAQNTPVAEVILALNPNVEGEATASYVSRALGDTGVRVTRLASGLPVGGDLDYADEVTLGRAFVGRHELSR